VTKTESSCDQVWSLTTEGAGWLLEPPWKRTGTAGLSGCGRSALHAIQQTFEVHDVMQRVARQGGVTLEGPNPVVQIHHDQIQMALNPAWPAATGRDSTLPDSIPDNRSENLDGLVSEDPGRGEFRGHSCLWSAVPVRAFVVARVSR
jgi:hypothetical protein